MSTARIHTEVKETSLTERYKKKLERRLLNPIHAASQVNIREIIVTHTDPIEKGEFGMNHFVQESENQVIARIFLQIQDLIKRAVQLHHQDNFDTENNKMKPECKNNITRLTTNEFFFYPCKNRGPLTNEGFSELIGQIESYAAELPDNLHLAFGTFPVKNQQKEVHNIALYIQCGPTPQINATTKAFPAKIDIIYPDTTTIFYNGYTAAEKFSSEITNLKNLIIACALNHLPPQTILRNVEKLLKFCRQNLSFNHTEMEQKQFSQLTQALIEKLQTISSSLSAQKRAPYQVIKMVDKMIPLLEKYIMAVEAAAHKTRHHLEENPDHFTGFITQTGGQITCRTPEARFYTIVEICLDHNLNTGQIGIEKSFLHYQKNFNQAFPTHLSQIVISNTTSINEEKLLTENNMVLHADPQKPGLKKHNASFNKFKKISPENREENITAIFGKKMDIYTYEPIKLSSIRKDLLECILSYNKLTLIINVYETLCIHYPLESHVLLPQLNQAVHEKLMNDLMTLHLEFMGAQFTRNKIVRHLRAMKTDSPDYCESLATYLILELLELEHNTAIKKHLNPVLSATCELLAKINALQKNAKEKSTKSIMCYHQNPHLFLSSHATSPGQRSASLEITKDVIPAVTRRDSI
ncbi:MAG: hypothetical protein ACD_45C00633G0009 [uncultured bacterium]|nr:MAG: hypothetical protein ACD_45C00633G0009 [uncultured bacterium]